LLSSEHEASLCVRGISLLTSFKADLIVALSSVRKCPMHSRLWLKYDEGGASRPHFSAGKVVRFQVRRQLPRRFSTCGDPR
jgi:hypothetical protein